MPFQFFLGGRGIGKSFSALQEIAENKDICAIWARRLDTEIDSVCAGDLFSSLKKKGKALDMTADYSKTKGIGRIYRDEEPVGYTTGVSTFSKIRGVDYPEITHMFIDELSPEEHRPYYKGEGRATFNMYETINRNRELEGEPPLIMIAMSNAVRLDTPVFLTLGIVTVIQDMIRRGQKKYTSRERGLYIEIMENIEVSQAKSQTALYKLLGGDSTITKANLDNKFVFDDLSLVANKKIPIDEYLPMYQYGDVAIYQHKSNSKYYCAIKRSTAPVVFDEQETQTFQRAFAFGFKMAVQSHTILFDDYSTFIRLAQVLNYKY